MAVIEIYDSEGKPELKMEDGELREGFSQNQKKNSRIQQLFFDGIKYTAEENAGKSRHTCFFRARERKGGRSEQFFAVYQGSMETPTKFVEQVEEIVDISDGIREIVKADDEILTDLDSGTPQFPRNYSKEKISQEIRRGEKLVFRADPSSAAKFLEGLFRLESGAGIGFSADIGTKKSSIKDAQVAILLDGDFSGLEELDDHRKQNQSKSVDDEPTGPAEWFRSILPF